MSTAPISSATTAATTAAATTAKAAAKRNPLFALLSLGAVGAAGWMIKDSFNGSKPVWDQTYEGIKEHAEWEDMKYGMGHYSGNPGMDGWAHKFKRLTLFGPMNLFIAYKRLTTYVGGFFKDVVMPNLLPIAVAIGGVYHTFGKDAIHKPVKIIFDTINSRLKPYNLSGKMMNGIKLSVEKTARGIGKAIVGVGGFAAKNPALALILGAIGLFTIKRFDDSYGHEGQHDFFRDFINTKGH